MHVSSPDQGSGTLALAVVLALTAGFVDAHVYLHVNQVFVANMSGNLIGLGMFVGLADWAETWPSAVALVAFVGGVALGTRCNRRELRDARIGVTRVLLGIEAVLIGGLGALLVFSAGGSMARSSQVVLSAVLLGATAMGLQAAALGKVGTIAVTTTYGTGSLVRVGQHTVRPAPGTPAEVEGRRRFVLVLLSVLGSYVGGAAVSALLGGSAWWLMLPTGALLTAAVLSAPSTRSLVE